MVLRRVGQKIPSELFDQELVVGHVVVQGVDNPFPIDPLVPHFVLFEPVRIGIASEVEPVPGPFFAEGGTLHQVVDQIFHTFRWALFVG